MTITTTVDLGSRFILNNDSLKDYKYLKSAPRIELIILFARIFSEKSQIIKEKNDKRKLFYAKKIALFFYLHYSYLYYII